MLTSNINHKYSTCDRRVRTVHLIQIDLAVVDSRSPTRWVYSTLAYNGDLPGKSVLDRVQPLGVQWGNDPHTFPAVARADSKPLAETVLAPTSLPQHYGCEKRLAGAVDQANSSCVSCHMGAFAAPPPYLNIQGVTIPAIFSFPGLCTTYNAANTAYFSDHDYPKTYLTARAEFLIKAILKPGVYQIIQLDQRQQFPQSDQKVIAELEIKGDEKPMAIPTNLPVQKRYYPRIKPEEIKRVRNFVFSGVFPASENPFVGIDFLINNNVYDELSVPQ